MKKRWWVVIYPAKLRDELIATIKRKKLDIKVYCPIVHVAESRKGLIKIVESPLFFNYMFWYYDLEALPYDELSNIMHFSLLKFPNDKKYMTPRYLTGKEVGRIEKVVLSYDNKFNRLRTDVKFLRKYIGWKVMVRDGAFTGMIGTISDVRKTGTLSIGLLIFNRPIKCDMAVEYVEFVK